MYTSTIPYKTKEREIKKLHGGSHHPQFNHTGGWIRSVLTHFWINQLIPYSVSVCLTFPASAGIVGLLLLFTVKFIISSFYSFFLQILASCIRSGTLCFLMFGKRGFVAGDLCELTGLLARCLAYRLLDTAS